MAFLLPVLAALALAAAFETGLGPLEVASQAPGSLLHLSPVPAAAETLPRGSSRITAGATWTNTWADSSAYRLDYELLATDVRVAYGLTDRTEIDASVTRRTASGGTMDSMIETFHRALNLTQGGRTKNPRNRFEVLVDPTRTQPGFQMTADQFASDLAQVRVMRRLRVADGGGPAVAAVLDAQAEDGSFPSPDVALGIVMSQSVGPVFVHGGVSMTRIASTRSDLGIRLRPAIPAGWGALEVPVDLRDSVVLQYLLTGGALADYRVFSAASHEVKLGWKTRILDRWSAEACFVENAFVMDNSPDFGFHAIVSRRF